VTERKHPIAAGAAHETPAAAVELVLVGNLLVDDIVFTDGRTQMGQAGGAMLYAALGASLWNTRVGLVSVAGSDYPDELLKALEARGADLSGIRRLPGQGLRTWLLYEPRARRVLHHLDSPTHAEVSPRPNDVPEAFLSARAFHLSPMPLESQRAMVAFLSKRPGAFVSLDPHEPVTEESFAGWLEVLKDADAFFPSADEVRLDAIDRDPRAVMRRFGVGRIRFVALKRGAGGGILWDRKNDRFHEWPPGEPPVVDNTGAGDAFAGGFLSGLLGEIGIERALERGVVSASFAIENWGARGLLSARQVAVERRLYRLFHVGEPE
jgi:ribokinase